MYCRGGLNQRADDDRRRRAMQEGATTTAATACRESRSPGGNLHRAGAAHWGPGSNNLELGSLLELVKDKTVLECLDRFRSIEGRDGFRALVNGSSLTSTVTRRWGQGSLTTSCLRSAWPGVVGPVPNPHWRIGSCSAQSRAAGCLSTPCKAQHNTGSGSHFPPCPPQAALTVADAQIAKAKRGRVGLVGGGESTRKRTSMSDVNHFSGTLGGDPNLDVQMGRIRGQSIVKVAGRNIEVKEGVSEQSNVVFEASSKVTVAGRIAGQSNVVIQYELRAAGVVAVNGSTSEQSNVTWTFVFSAHASKLARTLTDRATLRRTASTLKWAGRLTDRPTFRLVERRLQRGECEVGPSFTRYNHVRHSARMRWQAQRHSARMRWRPQRRSARMRWKTRPQSARRCRKTRRQAMTTSMKKTRKRKR